MTTKQPPPQFRKVRNQAAVNPKHTIRKNRSPWAPLAKKCIEEKGEWISVNPVVAQEKRFVTTAPLALTRFLKRESLSGFFEFGETVEGGVRKPCVRYVEK